MRILNKLSIVLMSACFCAALIGCQKSVTDQPKPKTDASKSSSNGTAGAKAESAIDKTKEKAKEIGSATKEKTEEITSTVKEKTREAGSSAKEKSKP